MISAGFGVRVPRFLVARLEKLGILLPGEKSEQKVRSVSRVLSAGISRHDDHLSRPDIATGLKRPTWGL